MHAGIELHPHGHRFAQFSRFQRQQLFFIVNRGVQMLMGNRRQVSGFKETF
ncbi:hypothetical protein D3C78_1874740 [compost metagenome]